jgi:hypothetical protein
MFVFVPISELIKNKMKQRRTFLQYLKDNRPWAIVIINILVLLIGIPALISGLAFISILMGVTFVLIWWMSFWDWKKKG